MIVCHCKAVNDRTILTAIADGAHDVVAVGAACGAGTGCGGCHGSIARLLDAAAAVEEAFVGTDVSTVPVGFPSSRPRHVREAARR